MVLKFIILKFPSSYFPSPIIFSKYFSCNCNAIFSINASRFSAIHIIVSSSSAPNKQDDDNTSTERIKQHNSTNHINATMVMILRSQTRAANLQQHAAVAPVLRGRQPQGGKARRAASLASTSAASISTAVGPDNTTNRGRQPKR